MAKAKKINAAKKRKQKKNVAKKVISNSKSSVNCATLNLHQHTAGSVKMKISVQRSLLKNQSLWYSLRWSLLQLNDIRWQIH